MNDNLGATIDGLNDGQRVFGRFTLKRLLGRGAMGVVWQAHDESLARDVALKFLPERVARDREAVENLKRETRRALELTHSRIVRIYDFVQDAQAAAISMEYIDGASLAALKLAKPDGHFEVEELRPLARQLCDALTYAHGEAKVIHRDLKPANLMLTSGGELKITDFGISAELADLGLVGTLATFSTAPDDPTAAGPSTNSAGTPVYMSPQQMMGEKPAVADDLYSLGATLYELLTGKPPFYSGHVIAQVQEKVPPSVAQRRKELGLTSAAPIPAAWEKTIAACLAKKPAQRPKSAAEIRERLEGSAKGEGVDRAHAVATPLVAIPPEGTPPPPKPTTRHPLRLLLVGLAALALLGGAAWFFSDTERGGNGGSSRPLTVQVFFTGFAAGDVVEIEGLGILLRVPPTGELGPRVNPKVTKVRALRDEHELFGPTEFDFRKTTEINLPKVLATRSAAALTEQAASPAATPARPRPEAAPRPTEPESAAPPPAQRSSEVARHQAAPVRAEFAETTDHSTSAPSPAEQPGPQPGQPWENGLGMKFVPVPGTAVQFSIWETRVQDFAAFVKATGHDATAAMYSLRNGKAGLYGDTWKSPGFDQGPTHPVVGVDKPDALAFCAWLTRQERAAGRLGPDQEYRLPTDAEWGAAAGPTYFPWGERKQWPPPRGAGNYADAAAKRDGFSANSIGSEYDDGFAATAPVGSFNANAFGIYDLGGNVWERAGGAIGVRGAAFDEYAPASLASAHRPLSGRRLYDVGFRVVCTRAGAASR